MEIHVLVPKFLSKMNFVTHYKYALLTLSLTHNVNDDDTWAIPISTSDWLVKRNALS